MTHPETATLTATELGSRDLDDVCAGGSAGFQEGGARLYVARTIALGDGDQGQIRATPRDAAGTGD